MTTKVPIFKEDQLKSIIRIIERLLKRVKWCELRDKQKIFQCVIIQSDICDYVKNQMVTNALSTKTEDEFTQYLRNSKNYYERKRRQILKQKRIRDKIRSKYYSKSEI